MVINYKELVNEKKAEKYFGIYAVKSVLRKGKSLVAGLFC